VSELYQHSKRDLRILESAPRVVLGRWPTPVEPLGPGLWVKRDDLCGYGRGGAKARKIEHVLGHLAAESKDELIAVAGNITNLAFDLLPAADRCGIHTHLLIADDPPAPREVREEIFAEIRDCVHLIGPGRVEAVCRMLAAYGARRSAGRRPFLLLPGASHPAALIGNACGFIEMIEQFEAGGLESPRTVFITAATGNTIGGFLIGENALRACGHPPVRIIGVQIYPGRLRWWTWAMIRWTERFAGLAGRVPLARIEIDGSALQGGFGRFTEGLAKDCLRVARETGIAIDPIFGGKTWTVMERRRSADLVEDPVLYWHCGFTPEWCAVGSRMNSQRNVG
jgi:1-aminocyclopropane-1-carboxylate deaminase/D-cysteine desulfhydrase-like pyridoxal-dependent ACC family enzyme